MIGRSSRWLATSLLAFALSSVAGAATIDSVLVVPNPYNVSGRTFGDRTGNLSGYERIRFANAPLPCTIQIYSSAGNLVKTLSFAKGTMLTDWDGRNNDNQYIDSDVYFYLIEHTETDPEKNLGRKLGKFVVIR